MSKDLAQQQTEWDLHNNIETFVPLEFTEEIKPETFGLEISKATEMVSGLSTTISERQSLIDAYADVINLPITTETLPIFKELRLKIVKNRTQGIEKWHKANKAFYLAGGRFVDAVKNKEVLVNEEMESKLLEAEKFFENQEKEKARLLNLERIEKIRPYVEDVIGLDFSEFSESDFADFVFGKKIRFENEQKEREAEALRIENERLAEIERQHLAEIENEKIRLENARLQKEAEAKELELKKEREKAEEERKIEANKQASIQAQKDLEIRREKEAKEKLEAEIKAKADAKLKAEIEAKKEAEKLAKAPIKQQLSVWVESFKISDAPIPNETSDEITAKFNAFKTWANNQINQL